MGRSPTHERRAREPPGGRGDIRVGPGVTRPEAPPGSASSAFTMPVAPKVNTRPSRTLRRAARSGAGHRFEEPRSRCGAARPGLRSPACRPPRPRRRRAAPACNQPAAHREGRPASARGRRHISTTGDVDQSVAIGAPPRTMPSRPAPRKPGHSTCRETAGSPAGAGAGTPSGSRLAVFLPVVTGSTDAGSTSDTVAAGGAGVEDAAAALRDLPSSARRRPGSDPR